MADSTDIDALVVQARATARELNELLEKLSMGGVRVSVVQPNREMGATIIDRVELGLVFPPERAPERAPGHYANTTAAGLAGAPMTAQEQL